MIDNAIKYTESGSVTLRYQAPVDGKIKLFIEDTGLGIKDEVQEKVFREFYQVHNPERDRKKGIGLGLAIVRRLCKLADIEMNLSSEVGRGTQIEFGLIEGKLELVEAKTSLAPASLINLTVALIEDEEDIRNASINMLENKGCTVLAADTIENALEILAQQDQLPDIIIADFRLRDNETGLQAIRRIRDEYNEEIPALLVTGDTAPSRLKSAAAESVDVLHKPVDIKVLETKLIEVASID